MKTLYLFLFLGFQIHANPSYKIEGYLKNCEHKYLNYGTSLFSISKGNKIILKKINIDEAGKFEIENLSPGVYEFKFDNDFGQIIQKNVEVKDLITTVEFCLNEFEDIKMETLFASMQNGDEIALKISDSGCFYHKDSEIIFFKTENQYSVSYFDEQKIKKTRLLTDSDLNNLILFEKKVRHINKMKGKSTSSTTYVFTKNDQIVLTEKEESGLWNGVRELEKTLK